ncbi:MAG: methyltransferase domain-containing protein [Micromonosporaceae bacterium]
MGTPALHRLASLLEPVPSDPEVSAGYLDLLGEAPEGQPTFAQSLMVSGWIPQVYERWWRPALGQLAKGVVGPTMAGERTIARDYLAADAGDVVLDIACGPGNFTRDFADAVGDAGLAIGLDASATMLRRAVDDTDAGNLAYLRADATELPFRDGSLDAVCCFAALHLFAEPYRVLDRVAAVLRPGGRIALMVSCGRGPSVVRQVSSTVASATGIRMFGPDEITGALADRGFDQVRQQIHGVVQFVGGTLAR